MPSVIAAGTTAGSAISVTGDTTGNLAFQTNGTTTALTLNTSQNASFVGSVDSVNTFGFKNRLINGAMIIDQRNAGAAVTVNTSASLTYTVDRWFGFGQTTDGVFTVQRSTTAPAGFINSLIATVTTADASIGATQVYAIGQYIEGLNVTDLGWGGSSAKTVTLSFWVRSSVTGTFGGSIRNAAANRSYPFSYTINSANTFEQKSITITGDTTGTWATDNTSGPQIWFSLGTGSTLSGTAGAWAASNFTSATGATSLISTLNATFYITGVQFEIGTAATSFDWRPYPVELNMCKRYYQKSVPVGTVPANNTTANTITTGNYAQVGGSGTGSGTSYAYGRGVLTPEMRATPTSITLYQPNGSAATAGRFGDIINQTVATAPTAALKKSSSVFFDVEPNGGGGLTDYSNPYGVNWAADAEL